MTKIALCQGRVSYLTRGATLTLKTVLVILFLLSAEYYHIPGN